MFCNGAQNRHSLSRSNPFRAQLVNVANCRKWEMDSLMRPVPSWLYSPSPTPRHSFNSPVSHSSGDQAPPPPTQQATHFPACSPPPLGPLPPSTFPEPLEAHKQQRGVGGKRFPFLRSGHRSSSFPELRTSPTRLWRGAAFKVTNAPGIESKLNK